MSFEEFMKEIKKVFNNHEITDYDIGYLEWLYCSVANNVPTPQPTIYRILKRLSEKKRDIKLLGIVSVIHTAQREILDMFKE